MSADNWAICPKCERVTIRKLEEDEATVVAQYGKLPIDQWEDMQAGVVHRRTEIAKYDVNRHTLREDWEIGTNNEGGEFRVHYTAGCHICKFEYSYDYGENV